MPAVPGLRSPYVKVGRLVFFGRMLDKIRLHENGRLPAEYVANLGDANPVFGDARCCRFLRVSYDEIRGRTLASHGDSMVLDWAEKNGGRRSDEECGIWNAFLMKLGWRDSAATRLRRRAEEWGLTANPIETLFDLIDFDEGRDPVRSRAWALPASRVVVIMGVAGSGKTTIGLLLASALGWKFRDGDEFHSPQSIAKMSSGIPLGERDRAPWIAAIRAFIDATLSRGENAIVACSALKESYRSALATDPDRVRLVQLTGSYDLIQGRLRLRQGHFMKSEMLDSQFATLEAPGNALAVDVARTPEAIVEEIRNSLSL